MVLFGCETEYCGVLSDELDIPIWCWNKSKIFSVKSVYNHMTRGENNENLEHIWKAKIPQKIKIFMWLVHNKSILTRDNMVKRKWQGDPTCIFCSQLETCDHLFFISTFCGKSSAGRCSFIFWN